MNNWIETAKQLLSRSLKPIPQELNELDWKSDISDKSERLAQHISAFANNPNGGFLVFGINDDGNIINLNKDKIDEIVKKIGNIARNNLAQPVAIEHDVIEFENKPKSEVQLKEKIFRLKATIESHDAPFEACLVVASTDNLKKKIQALTILIPNKFIVQSVQEIEQALAIQKSESKTV